MPEELKIKMLEEFQSRKCVSAEEDSTLAMLISKQKPLDSKKENKEESKYSEVTMTACAFSGNVHDTADILKPQSTWYLDSGASSHMCRDQFAFKEIRANNKQTLNLATMDSTKIRGAGVVKLKINNEVTAALQDTLFVPDLRSNLLSVAKMTDYGHEVTFKKDGATVVNMNNDKIIEAKRVGDLYIVQEACEFANVANVEEKSW
ncbi:PREDICTED: uncharacterized protein LOC108769473 [Trachymyrmex cornetzi]|uniref:uncharacterized protein LOC108769473 n=1 Tax=Trachymyrmex cornetzi TaxID=471704 RepID=UPI00084EDF31|nr:PREDICTED: uncharacterized protein LOC108769473 [Trachymyrmex cornetzi]